MRYHYFCVLWWKKSWLYMCFICVYVLFVFLRDQLMNTLLFIFSMNTALIVIEGNGERSVVNALVFLEISLIRVWHLGLNSHLSDNPQDSLTWVVILRISVSPFVKWVIYTRLSLRLHSALTCYDDKQIQSFLWVTSETVTKIKHRCFQWRQGSNGE